MDLCALGWDSAMEEKFAEFRRQGLAPARVANEDKHHYVIFTGETELLATVPGKLLHHAASNAELPKVGDWVAIELLPNEPKAVIHAVLPRRTELTRKVAGRDVEKQVLAANVDVAFIVQALDMSFNVRRLERFLVMVHEGGIQPIVLLNKADLCDAPDAVVAGAQAAAGAVPVFAVSARTGRGMKRLLELLPPASTGVFVGPSGVGKSSLINRLYGDQIQATIEVREHDAKGRHTTTWRELIPLPDAGLVIDTPGMREFHLWLADEGLAASFADVEEFAVRCHFRACSHTVEKRCAVLAAIEAGQLDRARLDNYLKLQLEQAYLAEEANQHTFQARKQRAKVANRALKKFYEDEE